MKPDISNFLYCNVYVGKLTSFTFIFPFRPYPASTMAKQEIDKIRRTIFFMAKRFYVKILTDKSIDFYHSNTAVLNLINITWHCI